MTDKQNGKRLPAVPAKGQAPGLGELLGGLADLNVEVTLELGRSKISLEQARQLGENALLEVGGAEGDPVDVRVNGELFARGKLVMVGEYYGVQLTEILG